MTDDEIPYLCFDGEPMLPDRDSYSMPLANGSIGTDLPGGPMRVRMNTLNNAVNINVTYTLDCIQSQYFADLYYGELLEGNLPLNVKLDLTASDLLDDVWYTATIVPGSANFPQFPGTINKISLTYNAVPKIDRCVMKSRILVAQAFGGYPDILDTCVSPLGRFPTGPSFGASFGGSYD